MEKKENAKSHSLKIEDRSYISLTGICDVDGFNDEQIVAITDYGQLVISGEILHIEELNVESGILIINGKINSVQYADTKDTTSILKRLFGG